MCERTAHDGKRMREVKSRQEVAGKVCRWRWGWRVVGEGRAKGAEEGDERALRFCVILSSRVERERRRKSAT
jgi:hypothetical protein